MNLNFIIPTFYNRTDKTIQNFAFHYLKIANIKKKTPKKIFYN